MRYPTHGTPEGEIRKRVAYMSLTVPLEEPCTSKEVATLDVDQVLTVLDSLSYASAQIGRAGDVDPVDSAMLKRGRAAAQLRNDLLGAIGIDEGGFEHEFNGAFCRFCGTDEAGSFANAVCEAV